MITAINNSNEVSQNNTPFFVWLLENECTFNNDTYAHLFKPFLEKCIDNTDLFLVESKEETIYQYLWVNGYSESVIMSFLRLWHVFEKCHVQDITANMYQLGD